MSTSLNYSMNKQELILKMVERNLKGETTPVENIFLKRYFQYKGNQLIKELRRIC